MQQPKWQVNTAVRRVWRLAMWRTRIAVRSERQRRGLGLLWWVLEPMMGVAVYWVVFQIGLRAGDENYFESLVIGLLLWRWYEQVVLHGGNSLILMKQEYLDYPVPKPVYPLSAFLLGSWKFIPVFAGAMTLLAIAGRSSFDLADVFVLLLAILSEGILILGGSTLLAAVVPYAPDLQQTVGFLVRLQFFVSNVVFPMTILPDSIKMFVQLNPVYPVIASAQGAALGSQTMPVSALLYPAALGLLLLAIGGGVLKRYSGDYGKISS